MLVFATASATIIVVVIIIATATVLVNVAVAIVNHAFTTICVSACNNARRHQHRQTRMMIYN